MMKKCLISGVAAFVLGGFLASCSHDDEWTSVVDSKLKAYEEVFHEEFGTIDPNQTWGFTRSSSFANTTRTHNKNSNEWASQGWNIPDPLTDAQKDKIRASLRVMTPEEEKAEQAQIKALFKEYHVSIFTKLKRKIKKHREDRKLKNERVNEEDDKK